MIARAISPRASGALIIFIVVMGLARCAPVQPPARPSAGSSATTVLLVSLDGFRADYLDRGLTPTLSRIAREGVRAEWMTPSYPSLTFPNHYTIVTGLRPDHTGVVHNTMRDAQLGGFSMSNPAAVTNAAWWGGEPVWVTAEKAGLPTAILFWPGSEAAIHGVRPRRFLPYDEPMTASARVDGVVEWLREPDATRPRFVSLYLQNTDDAGHRGGPSSALAREGIREIDTALGRLRDGLIAAGRWDLTDLVLVSDHGMATVPAGNVVAIEDMVDPEDALAVTVGQSVGFVPRSGREREAIAKLVGPHRLYECWRKEDLPPRWHYGTNPRIPPIVCQMREGWDAVPRATLAKRALEARGSHGFDPALKSMRAIFLARGPSLRHGVKLPPIENVDVYSLLMRLLGLKPLANDGNPRALAAAFAEPVRPN